MDAFSDKAFKSQIKTPLAERILATMVELLFFPGFTVPLDCALDDSRGRYAVWYVVELQPPNGATQTFDNFSPNVDVTREVGLGSSVAPASTAEMDENRMELMKFLLVLQSKSIYHSPGKSNLE